MSEHKRVGQAIRDALLLQRIDPTGLGYLTGVIPAIDWDVVGAAAVKATDHYRETAKIFSDAARRIEGYDAREARGDDVSGEVRPRTPGGSDF